MTVSCIKLWLLAVVCVVLLYQDGPRGNGVLCRTHGNQKDESAGKSSDEETKETNVSASESEDGNVSDEDDSAGGTSEGTCPKHARNCHNKSSRKKRDLDDEGEVNEDEDSGETTEDDDDEDDVKPITKKRTRNEFIDDTKYIRGKTYRDDDKEDEKENDVNYKKKKVVSTKFSQHKSNPRSKYNNVELNEDDSDEGNYKKGVKINLKRRNSKGHDDDDEDDVKKNSRRGVNRNTNKRGSRIQSEEDENDNEEDGKSEESDEVDNEMEEENESESSMTIIKGNAKDIVKFLNKEVKPFKLDSRKSNKELLRKMEKVTKKNKSQKNGDSTKGNINVYIYNMVKQNPRKKSLSKNLKKEALLSIVQDLLIPLMH